MTDNQYSHLTGRRPCVSVIDLLRARRAVITLNGYWIVSRSSGLPSPSVGSTNLFVVDIADNIDPLITVTPLKDFLLNKYLSFFQDFFTFEVSDWLRRQLFPGNPSFLCFLFLRSLGGMFVVSPVSSYSVPGLQS